MAVHPLHGRSSVSSSGGILPVLSLPERGLVPQPHSSSSTSHSSTPGRQLQDKTHQVRAAPVHLWPFRTASEFTAGFGVITWFAGTCLEKNPQSLNALGAVSPNHLRVSHKTSKWPRWSMKWEPDTFVLNSPIFSKKLFPCERNSLSFCYLACRLASCLARRIARPRGPSIKLKNDDQDKNHTSSRLHLTLLWKRNHLRKCCIRKIFRGDRPRHSWNGFRIPAETQTLIIFHQQHIPKCFVLLIPQQFANNVTVYCINKWHFIHFMEGSLSLTILLLLEHTLK